MKDPMVKLTAGNVIELEAFQVILQQNQIESVIRDQFLEGLHAGVPDGVPNNMFLYVLEHDSAKAAELYMEFKSSDQIPS